MSSQVGIAQQMHRNRLADWADKYLFMLTFAVGAGLIIGLKLLGVRQVLVTAAPVAAMLLYGGYILFSPRYRLRDDRAGDSLYYLGFLFTMVSLAYSLYEFAGTDASTRSIITNFGIALATTILGLTLRVIYHQMRQDPFDVEREAHFELTDAVSKLRGEVHEAIIGFGTLRIAVIQSLGESKAAVDASAATLRRQAKSIADYGNKTVNAIAGLTDRIAGIQVPPDLFNQKVQQILSPLDTAVRSAVDIINAEHTQVSKLIELFERAVGLVTKFSQELEVLQQEAAIQRDGIRVAMISLKETCSLANSAVASVVATANRNVTGQKELLQLLESTTAATRRAVEAHREKLTADVAASTDLLSQVHKALVSLTRTIAQSINGQRN